MFYTIIYFLLVTLITYRLYKKKLSSLGRIVFTYISIIGAFSVYAMSENIFPYVNITLIPYLFLILIYCIALSPFMKSDKVLSHEKVDIIIDRRYRYFLYLYIFCASIYLFWSIPTTLELMQSGEWADNYADTVGQGGRTFSYSNRLVWLAVQIYGYTALLAVLLSFLYLRDKRYTKLAYVSLLIYVISTMSSAIVVSSRGMLFDLFFLFLGLFLFFYKDFQARTKKVAYVFTVLASLIIVPYVIDVTISRFTEDAATDSIINYFSQPPIIFNSGVASIDQLSYGNMAFGSFMDGVSINQKEVGGSWGTGFYTFVGWLYIDWGPIGTTLICIFFAYCINRIVLKRKYEVTDLFLIFYYFEIMLQGVLVLGGPIIIKIIMTMVLWALMKIFIENKKDTYMAYN